MTVSGGRVDSAKLKAHESAGAPNDPATVLRVKLCPILCHRPQPNDSECTTEKVKMLETLMDSGWKSGAAVYS